MCQQGLTGKALSCDVSQLLADVNLSDKSGVVAKKLSGGMKRKLRCVEDVCVCVCVLGS